MSTQRRKQTWDDIKRRNLVGFVIILDVDGVLMADGENTISDEIQSSIETLKKNNDIRIVSNTFRKARCKYASSVLNVVWVDSPYRKPSTRILKYIDYDTAKPLLVIGDKILTDGVFASRIGAEAIIVHRRTNPKDRWLIKLTYLIDDFIFALLSK